MGGEEAETNERTEVRSMLGTGGKSRERGRKKKKERKASAVIVAFLFSVWARS